MSSTYAEPVARLTEALDEIAAINPAFRTTGEKQDLMAGLARVIARAQAQQLRVLAAADDVAEKTGARSAAAWLADQTRDAPGRIRVDARLADALDQRWTRLGVAFAEGQVNLSQVRVISEALSSLPKDLGDDLLTKAEAYLVEQAADFGPRELANLGRGVLQHLAPDVADEAEYQRLLEAERKASAATRLTLRRRGDGSTDGHFRIPDFAAGLLRAYLNAFTAPRRRHLDDPFGPLQQIEPDEFANLPLERQRGIALVALLERVLSGQLPQHGGKAATVSVTIDLGDPAPRRRIGRHRPHHHRRRLTVGQVRRLACEAGILPFVMDGESVVREHGRGKRLFDHHQRAALNLMYPECTAVGCTMPAEFCHVVFPRSDGHHHSGRIDHGEVSSWRLSRKSSRIRSSRCIGRAVRSWSWARSSISPRLRCLTG